MGTENEKNARFIQREETIIRSAMELFIDHGIESVTIDRIAQKAGIGKGTIYKHFSSKNEIFADLVIRHNQNVINCFNDVPLNAPVMVQLKKTMRGIWDLQTEHIQIFRVYRKCEHLLTREGLPPGVLARLKAQGRMRHDFIGSMIQKGIDEEIFRNESVDNMSAVAVGLFRGVFDLMLEGEVKPSEALYLLVEKMIFNGFMR